MTAPARPASASDADAEALWDQIEQGSEELALALGIDRFDPRALPLIDEWLDARFQADDDGSAQRSGAPSIDEEEVARLGLFLARVLLDTHGGGLARIDAPRHPLHGEWTVTGFTRGLLEDFHVPFVVSASRMVVQRSLRAVDWYKQLEREGSRR